MYKGWVGAPKYSKAKGSRIVSRCCILVVKTIPRIRYISATQQRSAQQRRCCFERSFPMALFWGPAITSSASQQFTLSIEPRLIQVEELRIQIQVISCEMDGDRWDNGLCLTQSRARLCYRSTMRCSPCRLDRPRPLHVCMRSKIWDVNVVCSRCCRDPSNSSPAWSSSSQGGPVSSSWSLQSKS